MIMIAMNVALVKDASTVTLIFEACQFYLDMSTTAWPASMLLVGSGIEQIPDSLSEPNPTFCTITHPAPNIMQAILFVL